MSDISRHNLMDNFNYFYGQVNSEESAAILAVGVLLADTLFVPSTSLEEIAGSLDAIRFNSSH
jgi:hypothetical protein